MAGRYGLRIMLMVKVPHLVLAYLSRVSSWYYILKQEKLCNIFSAAEKS
jgi:hypothetical protein